MNITVDQIVDREVIYCVSSMMYQLAQNQDALPSEYQEDMLDAWRGVPDYEEAAIQEGWLKRDGEIVSPDGEIADSWEDACDISNVEPYEQEVYEHWIVSTYLADRLEEKGERVIRDFLGLDAIWCRTTTGQAISMDHVIGEIHREMIA